MGGCRRTAGLAAAGVVVAAALSGCGSGHHTSAPTTVPTTAAAPTTSAPSPSSTPTTVAPSTTTTAPSTTTTVKKKTSVVGLLLSGVGNTFTAPKAPTTKPYSTNCQSLIDPGFFGNCVTVSAPSGTIAAIVEHTQEDYAPGQPIAQGQERDLVYFKVNDTWSLRLRRIPGANGEALTQVSESDIMRDNDPKAVFVEPAPNSQFGDELDVVEADGDVTLYRQLHGGFARVPTGGGLETYVPAPSGGYDDSLIKYTGGAWRIASEHHISQSQAAAEGDSPFSDPQGTDAS